MKIVKLTLPQIALVLVAFIASIILDYCIRAYGHTGNANYVFLLSFLPLFLAVGYLSTKITNAPERLPIHREVIGMIVFFLTAPITILLWAAIFNFHILQIPVLIGCSSFFAIYAIYSCVLYLVFKKLKIGF